MAAHVQVNISNDNNHDQNVSRFMTYPWYTKVLCYKEDNEMNVQQCFLSFQPPC